VPDVVQSSRDLQRKRRASQSSQAGALPATLQLGHALALVGQIAAVMQQCEGVF